MARRRRVDRRMRELRERKYRLRGRAKASRFIPDKDSDFAHMAKVFARHATEQAQRFGLSPEQLDKLNSAVAAFRDALRRTFLTDEAGPKATRIKNAARKAAEESVRTTARFIRGVAGDSLTSVDCLLLNFHQRPERLKRRECPQIAPVLRFVGTTDPLQSGGGGKHILEYGNDFDRASNAKPHGAVRLELFVGLVPPQLAAAKKVPAKPYQCSCGPWYLRSFSTSRFEVEPPMLKDGTPMLVVYWGRWADARGNFGPFSTTCVARVEGGPLPALPMYFGKQPALESAERRIEPKLEFVQAMYQLPGEIQHEQALLPGAVQTHDQAAY